MRAHGGQGNSRDQTGAPAHVALPAGGGTDGDAVSEGGNRCEAARRVRRRGR